MLFVVSLVLSGVAVLCNAGGAASGLLLLQTRASLISIDLDANTSNASNETKNFGAESKGPNVRPIFLSLSDDGTDHSYSGAQQTAIGYTPQGVAFYASGEKLAHQVPIYSFFDPQLHDNCYSQSAAAPDGYSLLRIEFYAYPEPFPYTIPIYGFWNGQVGDHIYSKESFAPEGFKAQGVQFYAYAHPPVAQVVTCDQPPKLNPGKLIQNNLGGKGPGTGINMIRYGQVGETGDGKSVDLVITAPNYTKPSSGPLLANGFAEGNKVWKVLQEPNSSTKLQFSFVASANISLPLTMKKVTMTFFNIDAKKFGNLTESLDICGTDTFFLTTDSSLRKENLEGGCTRFQALNTTNYTQIQPGLDLTSLTAAQLSHSVTAQFSTIQTFTVTTSLSAGMAAKSLFFAGIQAIGAAC